MDRTDDGDDVVEALTDIVRTCGDEDPPNGPWRVTPHVVLGDASHAHSGAALRRMRITDLLDLTGRNCPPSRTPLGKVGSHLAIDAVDRADYDLLGRHVAQCTAFLRAVKQRNGVALVYCAMGVNRSAAIVLAYLMLEERMPLLDAARLLRRARGCMLSNAGFRRQLAGLAKREGLA